MVRLPFADRDKAGCALGEELAGCGLPSNMIVLALPRGGVPVGLAVAEKLHVPLDVVIVRKLGVPWQPELAMGAVAGRSFQVLDDRLIQRLGIPQKAIDAVVAKEQGEIKRREKLYRRDRPAPDLKNQTTVIVDDGLATGSTMLVAARYVRSLTPERSIIAVPVGSIEACRKLQKEADEFVCLATPEPFSAVGEWYSDFRQVSDSEVQRMLQGAHRSEPQKP